VLQEDPVIHPLHLCRQDQERHEIHQLLLRLDFQVLQDYQENLLHPLLLSAQESA
jgi:hypothetical protein